MVFQSRLIPLTGIFNIQFDSNSIYIWNSNFWSCPFTIQVRKITYRWVRCINHEGDNKCIDLEIIIFLSFVCIYNSHEYRQSTIGNALKQHTSAYSSRAYIKCRCCFALVASSSFIHISFQCGITLYCTICIHERNTIVINRKMNYKINHGNPR